MFMCVWEHKIMFLFIINQKGWACKTDKMMRAIHFSPSRMYWCKDIKLVHTMWVTKRFFHLDLARLRGRGGGNQELCKRFEMAVIIETYLKPADTILELLDKLWSQCLKLTLNMFYNICYCCALNISRSLVAVLVNQTHRGSLVLPLPQEYPSKWNPILYLQSFLVYLSFTRILVNENM